MVEKQGGGSNYFVFFFTGSARVASYDVDESANVDLPKSIDKEHLKLHVKKKKKKSFPV